MAERTTLALASLATSVEITWFQVVNWRSALGAKRI
jgi:hypothetical protein